MLVKTGMLVLLLVEWGAGQSLRVRSQGRRRNVQLNIIPGTGTVTNGNAVSGNVIVSPSGSQSRPANLVSTSVINLPPPRNVQVLPNGEIIHDALYDYHYLVNDDLTGDHHGERRVQDGDVVKGSYFVAESTLGGSDTATRYRIVEYEAGPDGTTQHVYYASSPPNYESGQRSVSSSSTNTRVLQLRTPATNRVRLLSVPVANTFRFTSEEK